MWHWLRKSVLAIDPLVRLCIVLSSGVHLALLLSILVSYWLKPAQQIAIFKNTSITKDVTIIIDPYAPVTGVVMQKSTQKTVIGSEQTTGSLIKHESKKSDTTLVAEKKTFPARTQKLQKVAPKKAVQKQKKQPPKPVKKQPVKPKKEAPKKTTQKAPQQKPKKTIVEKPKKLLAKKDKEHNIEAPIAQASQQENIPGFPQDIAIPEGIQGPIMVARSASDAAGLAVQLEIQEALSTVWHPPVGIEEGVSCQIRVHLKSDGKVQSLEIIKPSGIMLFDVSARAAIQKAVWPRAMWGTVLELCLQ